MNHGVIFALLAGLIGWRLYRRIRRNIGRQKLRPKRIIVSMILFAVASAFIIATGLQHTQVLLGFGGGVLFGALLGFLGLRLTRFETTNEGHFYTPDTRIGVGLSLLLAGRILYRVVYMQEGSLTPDHPAVQPTPLTFLIVGSMVGYYLVYYVGLFVHTHDRKG